MITTEVLTKALEELSSIPFFPTAEAAQLVIGKHMLKFVSGPTELRWLVDSAVNAMRKWEGIPELRGLYCTRYKPVDGVEGTCSLAGYSPADNEAAGAAEIAYAPAMALLGDGREPDLEAEAAIADLAGGPVSLKRLPVPLQSDREYSRKLLEGIIHE